MFLGERERERCTYVQILEREKRGSERERRRWRCIYTVAKKSFDTVAKK